MQDQFNMGGTWNFITSRVCTCTGGREGPTRVQVAGEGLQLYRWQGRSCTCTGGWRGPARVQVAVEGLYAYRWQGRAYSCTGGRGGPTRVQVAGEANSIGTGDRLEGRCCNDPQPRRNYTPNFEHIKISTIINFIVFCQVI